MQPIETFIRYRNKIEKHSVRSSSRFEQTKDSIKVEMNSRHFLARS
ncbi:hypothetical protein O9993_03730 [Vibrio lentus]|nr:hypothetical protein [Vibrio lentus]